jgi:hypothetical protein
VVRYKWNPCPFDNSMASEQEVENTALEVKTEVSGTMKVTTGEGGLKPCVDDRQTNQLNLLWCRVDIQGVVNG